MRQRLKQFIAIESSSGIFLLMTTLLAMVLANSPVSGVYQQLVQKALFTVNDGLMAIFFLGIGLELKRGFQNGPLSQFSQVVLPLTAAIGGMAVPAGIYYLFNRHDSVMMQAWATPVATDIAFAVGVLSLFTRRISPSLKLFLLALAIFDDIGAILIITFFYSSGLVYAYLVSAIILIVLLYLFNLYKVKMLTPYLLIGALLWVCILKSGIHATIAGVVLAFFIPNPVNLERRLHPWIAFGIMPMFALVNAGFSLEGLSWDVLTSSLVLGIMAGLFVGKQIGVFGFVWLIVRSGCATLPQKATWWEIYGVALLCGIGFTMSLFLGTLSFESDSIYLSEVRVGVMLGSLLSGVVGALILHITSARQLKRRSAIA